MLCIATSHSVRFRFYIGRTVLVRNDNIHIYYRYTLTHTLSCCACSGVRSNQCVDNQ